MIKVIKVFEAFSGYGSQSLALERLGIEHEVVCISEIDKYAIQAYEALHGAVRNLGDISKINEFEVPEHDLFTYSFPCQDISVAGLQKGITESTRSGLLWECERIIKAKRPRYLLMENVKNLVSKKFKADFDKWCMWLEGQGYTNYWKILNAKDYGIPQNRERVFMISILGKHEPFEWPVAFYNGLRLKDVLEEEVEEKYYVSNEKAEKLIMQLKADTSKDFILGGEQKNQAVKYDGITTTLTSSMGCGGGYVPMVKACLTPDRIEKRQNGRRFKEDGEPMFTLTSQDRHGVLQSSPIRIGNIYGDDKGTGFAGNVWSKDAMSPTLTTMQGGNRQPMVMVREATKQGYDIAMVGDSININQPNSSTRRGRVGKEICNTLTTQQEYATLTYDFRIRKLTPRECFRLMGLHDDEIDKIQQAGISNSQQYKLAGNSIVVDVLEAIFKELFK